MKRLIFSLGFLLVLSSCGDNKASDTNKEEQKANPVSDDLINNPATAENPTQTTAEFAVMEFKSTFFDFGDILENQKVETTYEFKNTGKVDLLISSCTAMCGCTVPEWPREPIKPGESGKIKVVFDSAGKSGENNKKVTVTANIKDKTIELSFRAKVRAIQNNG